jgi:ATP-dependent exoDNAse (exonuclease V) alpha subunit
VIIDEAGMADTLSLDTAVQFAIARGASVRLIGDDQQLAAIGAGGVLRDITQTHGAVHLAELHRFTDPAEAAASLALREGKPEALNFYLDHGRIHVGDLATTTQAAFAAWVSDRSAGLMPSCSPPPGTWSPNSTVVPVIIASATSRSDGRCTWPTAIRAVSEM